MKKSGKQSTGGGAGNSEVRYLSCLGSMRERLSWIEDESMGVD
jgi:hypothetical protein